MKMIYILNSCGGMKMSTETKTVSNIQHQQKPDSENSLNTLAKHGELIAALTSGAIILTTWSLSNVLPNSLWIILHIIAFIIGGYAQAKEGILSTIEEKELNVELLMVIAAIGSASIGYWTEGAILIFIFSLAGALETYTINKSDKEISLLMDLQPEEARIIENDMERMIPVVQLKINDHIFVRAGERIPADGFIEIGRASCRERVCVSSVGGQW